MKKLSLILLMSHTILWAGWHDRKAEGWAWYEQQKPPTKEAVPQQPTQQMQEVRKILEEKLAQAVLEPTAENIQSYMAEQQKWIERSSYFAHMWSQVLLNHPQLDYTATNTPVSQYGLQFHKQKLQEQKEQLITSLVKEYGLVFFYEGQSQTSPIFGQIVKAFSKKYGWETVAVVLDDIEMEGFSHKQNPHITQALGVDITPALYLINPKENIAIPIAFGLVAIDQIEENILLQFREHP